MEIVKLNPEALDVANKYLECFSVEETAAALALTHSEVLDVIEAAPVKRYIDNVFLDTGYRNKHKLGQLLDKIVESKIEEADETGVYSGKDLLDVLKFIHETTKPDKVTTQVNISQTNNYKDLMRELLE